MMIKWFILLMLFLLGPTLDTQAEDSLRVDRDKYFTREFQLIIENDVFLIPSRDRYYSSGIGLVRRTAPHKEHKFYKAFAATFPNLKNLIWGLALVHNFYTNRRISESNVSQFDHPYAGWLYAATDLNVFVNSKSSFYGQFDIGVVGPLAGGEEIQEAWHRAFGLDAPQGWDYQMNNTPAINLKLAYNRELITTSFFGLISESSFQFGTIKNNLRQDGVIRLGKVKPFYNTIYTNSKLGNGMQKSWSSTEYDHIEEIYIYAGAGIEYVIYNSIIDGNFIGQNSVHTESSEKWVTHWVYGIHIGGYLVDVRLEAHRNSPVTTESTEHGFFRLALHVRY